MEREARDQSNPSGEEEEAGAKMHKQETRYNNTVTAERLSCWFGLQTKGLEYLTGGQAGLVILLLVPEENRREQGETAGATRHPWAHFSTHPVPPEGIQAKRPPQNSVSAGDLSSPGAADTHGTTAPLSPPEDATTAEPGRIQHRAGFDANPPTRGTHESAQEKRIHYNP